MARRSDHSREELYDMALTAARELVDNGDHKALTARNVATKIGYSPGTLYNLFKNLSDLVVHLNARTLDEMQEQLARVSLTGDPRADLEELAVTYIDYVDQNPHLWALLFSNEMPSADQLPEWYLQKVGRLFLLIETALAPLFETGREDERAQSARVLWSSFHGIVTLAGTGKLSIITGNPVKQLTDHLIETFLVGLERR